ncbi:MAG: SPOR domain-containing protein [Candidatus Calescibacterium sp.]|nr:SPOR domain-containing protein [Candidatus Calescibacterium sp.]MDW8133236.1 SPOR domain-containing protein [Candidatus Calescibacterium sp.]
MKYVILLILIVAVSAIGYYAGQYFYKEKISTAKDVEKPLISPLIEEKKYNTFPNNNQPSIIIPSIEKKETIKNKDDKTTVKSPTNTSTIINTTTTITTDITTTTENINQEREQQEKEEITNKKITEENTQKDNGEATDNNKENTEKNTESLYYIQLGSFLSIDNAQSTKNQLESIGLNPKIEQIITGGNTIYRVVIGPYRTEDEALQESNKLKKMGFDNVIRVY